MVRTFYDDWIMGEAKQDRSNRREFPRYAAERNFFLILKAGGEKFNCQIIDLSLSGALIICPKVPQGVREVFFEDPASPETFRANVRWHSSDRIGLQFDFSGEALNFVSHYLQETRYSWEGEQISR